MQLFFTLGGSGDLTGILTVVNHVLHPVNLVFIDPLHPVEVVNAHVADGVRRVAVQIDQRLEPVLLAAVEQPVDGALLENFTVVGKEVLQEIIPDDLPGSRTFVSQSLSNEIQIFLQRVCAIDLF